MKKIIAVLIFSFLFPQIVFARSSNDPFLTQWSYQDINIFTAWNYGVGSRDVIVAIIDNGFDTFHPDLIDNAWKNPKEIEGNNIDDDGNGYIDDVWGWNFVQEDKNKDKIIDEQEKKGDNNPRPNSKTITEEEKKIGVYNHGTVVAGIIGAVGDNGIDGSGLNWKVKLMNLKVVDNSGSGDLVLLGPAIRYAVDKGASVINISMVGNRMNSDVTEALRYASANGVVVVGAAGNDARLLDEEPRYPICVDAGESKQLILGVSAIDESHHLAPFSNFGSKCVDITAPGTNIFSAMRYEPADGLMQEYGGAWNGTSFAAPFVSGAAALVKSIQPTWKADQIYSVLLGTVHKTPPIDDVVYTHLFGKGLLQVDKALAQAMLGMVPSSTPNVVAPPVVVTPTPVAPTAPTQKIVEPLSVLLFNDKDAKSQVFNYDRITGFGASTLSKEMVFLQYLESLSRYKNDFTESMYGVLYFRYDGNSIVRLYNKNFDRMGGFKKKLEYPSTLVLADVSKDSEPEIVLAPKVADTVLFTVYDKNGNEFFHVNAKEKHSGVSITRVFNPELKKDDIVVLYKQGTRVFLEKYNGKGEKIEEHELSAKTDLGGLFYGDVDGDGNGEFAMIVLLENTVWVRYYDKNGNFLKRVPVVQLTQKDKKVNVNFDDYDSDGKFEIMVTERTGGRGVYGVFGRGEQVQRMMELSNDAMNNYFIVPFVK